MELLRTVLAELVTPKFIALYLYVGAVCYVHFRGKARLRFGRQLTEHSGLAAPINALLYLFSAVPKDPILPVERFPQLLPLRDAWRTFRDEALALSEGGHIRPSERHDDLTFVAFYRRGWKRFYLKWYDDPMPSARALCPRSVALIESIPDVNAAAFTLLPPGKKLGRHRDPFACSLRLHLGLVTPNSDDCRIWVDGVEYSWRDGEAMVFDETYVHWARNDTDEPRIILFVDVTRPLHTRVMRALNGFVIRRLLGATKSRNEDDESVGVLNRLTPKVYALKNFFLSFKKHHRTTYYAAKYTLAAGLFYALFLHGLVVG